MFISNIDQNVIFYDSSADTFTELTVNLNNYRTGLEELTFDIGDRLFIATPNPFNHRFFKLGSPSSNTDANLIIEYYDGNEWVNPSRILDYTAIDGATFAKSGIVQFTPENEDYIAIVSDSQEDIDLFTNGPHIYDKYWQAIGFDASTDITFKYIGSLFNNDSDLYALYPLLNNARLLTQWEDGKTSWEEQSVTAANLIAQDLSNRSIIMTSNSILDTVRFGMAAIHRSAHLIFSGLGQDRFEKEIDKSLQRYYAAMNMKKFNTDQNNTATLEKVERAVSTGFLGR